jgi:hypothetical protein
MAYLAKYLHITSSEMMTTKVKGGEIRGKKRF